LVSDKSERTGGALSTFIFGPEKSNKDRIIDYKRAEQLVSGFGEYSSSSSGALIGREISNQKIIEEQAEQILDLLLTEDDSLTPLQEIFLEQIAKIISSGSRGVWSELRQASGTLPGGRSVLGTIVDPLGLWRSSPVVAVSELDNQTIETTRNLILLLQEKSGVQDIQDSTTDLSNEEIVEIVSNVSRKLWTRRSSVFKTGQQLAINLVQLTADKLEKGERSRPAASAISEGEASLSANDGRIHSETKPSPSRSRRLSDARSLLAELEKEDTPHMDMPDVKVPEVEEVAVGDPSITTVTGKDIEYDEGSGRFYEKSPTLSAR